MASSQSSLVGLDQLARPDQPRMDPQRGTIPEIALNNGVLIPQLGFGVFLVPDDQVTDAVISALECGYRSIDTASAYQNEAGVGRALRAAGLPRDELFITTKLWNEDQGYDETLRAFEASLERLGLSYLDLYLIHWPVPARGLFVESWRALNELLEEGSVRAIGVSNFEPSHLAAVNEATGSTPAVNQIELHPYFSQLRVRAADASVGIVTQAWSPLAPQTDLLSDPVIAQLARRHGRTPAQIVLRWHIQLGNVVIPKSVTPARIAENIDIFGFSLDDADMAAIAKLDLGIRTGPNPETFFVP
jgi:2,5-diketo-D-gluconate reductase A